MPTANDFPNVHGADLVISHVSSSGLFVKWLLENKMALVLRSATRWGSRYAGWSQGGGNIMALVGEWFWPSTIVYIDGFNLYFGLTEKGWRKYLWLDLKKFANWLLLPDQTLVHTKYFTSRITKPVSKQRRQSIFIDALNTLWVHIIHFK